MKKNIFNNVMKAAGVTMLIASALTSQAQTLQSGYFTDNFLYRYTSNPAFGNEKNFVAMPALGNMNIGTSGNIGVKHFIYNVNGKTTTFLNPGVTADEVLSGLKDKMRLGTDINEQILAFGFKSWGGYNTVTVGTRANVGMYFPKDLIVMAKQGIENSSYNIGNMGFMGQAWGQIALNHSHQILPELRVGATLKVLMGVGNIETKINRADLSLGQDNWTAEVDAELYASAKGIRYETDYNENTKRKYVSGINGDDFSPMNGFGMAFDLGAVYNLGKDWEFSLSLLDLGFIHWSETQLATTDGLQKVETDKYTFQVKDDHSFDKLKDDLSMLYELKDAGNIGGRTTGVGATLKVGAKYILPVYDKVNFGILNTTRFQGDYSWTDFRLAANITPVKCFSAGLNLGMGTFGTSVGMILNLNVTGFNFFLASDHIPGKLAKQGVPLSSNLNFNMGFNFPF